MITAERILIAHGNLGDAIKRYYDDAEHEHTIKARIVATFRAYAALLAEAAGAIAIHTYAESDVRRIVREELEKKEADSHG